MPVDENMLVVYYFTFLENGKFNSAIAFLDADNNEVLGYSGRSTGDYSLLDDVLATQTTLVYNVPESADARYVTNAELVQTTENFSSDKKVEFVGDKMTWIYPPCGPLENCIGSREFEKYTPIEF